ncbi:MAG: hypothetical protein SF097_03745 [Acidobacteriota bacterium]|nr:hypothetical protein [Acidobacteriota bacterium]
MNQEFFASLPLPNLSQISVSSLNFTLGQVTYSLCSTPFKIAPHQSISKRFDHWSYTHAFSKNIPHTCSIVAASAAGCFCTVFGAFSFDLSQTWLRRIVSGVRRLGNTEGFLGGGERQAILSVPLSLEVKIWLRIFPNS